MTTWMTVEFGCCDSKYTLPVALKQDQLLLHQPALGDTMINILEAQHDREHPECPAK